MRNDNLCQQPDYGISCAGCCGTNVYESREELVEAIEINTSNFRPFIGLRPRKGKTLYYKSMRPHSDSGIATEPYLCPLLIFLDDEQTRIGCSAHPGLNGIDYREKLNLCRSRHMCKPAEDFSLLNQARQRKILEKLSRQYKGDWILLSMDMGEERIEI